MTKEIKVVVEAILQRQQKERNKASGFTLIELIIVIAIIGILIAIAIPVYGAWRDNAEAAPMKSDLRLAAEQLEIAKSNSGAYPTVLPSSVVKSTGNKLTLQSERTGTIPATYNQYKKPGVTMNVKNTDSVTSNRPPPLGNLVPVNVRYYITQDRTIKADINCPVTMTHTSGSSKFMCLTEANYNPTTGAYSSGRYTEFGGNYVHALCKNKTTSALRLHRFFVGAITPPNKPSGWVDKGPASFTTTFTSTQVCNQSERILGVSFEGTTKHSTEVGQNPFRFAQGVFADPAAPGSDYCIEATSTKNDQVWSWSSNGGLREGACP